MNLTRGSTNDKKDGHHDYERYLLNHANVSGPKIIQRLHCHDSAHNAMTDQGNGSLLSFHLDMVLVDS